MRTFDSRVSEKVAGPVLAQVVLFIVNWLSSGEFDRVELAQVAGIVLTALLGWALTDRRFESLKEILLARKPEDGDGAERDETPAGPTSSKLSEEPPE